MIDAGDPRVIPTLLEWLAAETDAPAGATGSPRLAEAFRGIEALHVQEAVPLLISLYEGSAWTHRHAGLAAAIRIDPTYAPDLLRDLISTPPGAHPRGYGTLEATAAAALVQNFGDDAARAYLLAGFQPEFAQTFAGQMMRQSARHVFLDMNDDALRRSLLKLADTAPVDPSEKGAMLMLAETIRLNALPLDELIALTGKGTPRERAMAFNCLARRGGRDALPAMDAVARAFAAEGQDWGAFHVDTARRRLRAGKSDANFPPPAPDQPTPDGQPPELPVRITSGTPAPDGSPRVGMYAVAGGDPIVCTPATPAVERDAQGFGYQELALVRLSDDRSQLLSIRPYEARPGETSRDGWVFVELRRVRKDAVDRDAVLLQKLGRRVLALVPRRTAATGEKASDRRTMQRIANLRPADVVDARLNESPGEPATLAAVAPYRPALPARFVRLTEVRPAAGKPLPAVELRFGAKNQVYLLPRDDDGPPSLPAELLRQLPPGCTLRFKTDGGPNAAAAPVLADLRLDGGVSTPPGDARVTEVRSGGATWGERGVTVNGGDAGRASRIDAALARLRYAQPGGLPNLPPDTVAQLKDLARHAAPMRSQVTHDEVAQLAARRGREADPYRRDALDQEMFLRLQRLEHATRADQADRAARASAILTPDQLKGLLEWNQPPIPRMAAPATRPAPAATRPT